MHGALMHASGAPLIQHQALIQQEPFFIDLCPPSLTCLVLEGIVRLDPLTPPSSPAHAPPASEISHAGTPVQQLPHASQPSTQPQANNPVQGPTGGLADLRTRSLAAPPLLTPRLQRLSVVLARHPREPVPHQAAAGAAPAS
eukprot:scaffold87447_cov20-Tisochrysis_lutea.AAC.1